MGYTEAQMLTRVSTALNDPSTAIWGTAELRAHMDQEIRELSMYSAYYGKATVTFASTVKELVLSTISDLMEVEDIEYEVDLDPPRYRNFKLRASTAIMDIDFWPDTGDSAYVYYRTPHVVSGTGTNTLNPTEERLLIELTAGAAAISKAATIYNQVYSGISAVASAQTAIGAIAAQLSSATSDIAAGRTQASLMGNLALTAGTMIANMTNDLATALTNLNTGGSILNTVPVGGGAVDYMNQAASFLQMSNTDLRQAEGYLSEARVDAAANSSYISLASQDVNVATGKINEAVVNLRKVSSQLSIAGGGRLLEAWGRDKKDRALKELEAIGQNDVGKIYTRWPTVK